MIDPKKVDVNQILNEAPKKFCDGAIGASGKDLFYFGLTSGNNIDPYMTTPRIMKDISIFMNNQIQNYEKRFGEIDMKIPEIISPIQQSDLKNPGGDKK